jgi:hypothetical protein
MVQSLIELGGFVYHLGMRAEPSRGSAVRSRQSRG